MGPKLKILCQLSGMMPGLLVFVSTLTITGIAIDRYKVIVYSTGANRNNPKLWTTILSLVCIWVISILLSFPLFLGMDMFVNDLNETMGPVVAGCMYKLSGETSMAYCYEAWGKHGKKRIFFSIFSLVVQFILPLTLIGMA